MFWNENITSLWQALCSTTLQICRKTPHSCRRKEWLMRGNCGSPDMHDFLVLFCLLMSSAWERIIKDHTLIWNHCNRLNRTFFLVKRCLTLSMIFPFSSLSYFLLSMQRQNRPYHFCQRTSSKCFIKFWLQVSIKGRLTLPDQCTEQGVQKRFLHNLFNHREAYSLAHAQSPIHTLICHMKPSWYYYARWDQITYS